MTVPDFETRDPTAPGFWSERFEKQFMPWDRAGVPDDLRRFVARTAPAAVLIPGCGTGHEVAFFAEGGWDVTAIDFAPAAVAVAKQNLGRWADRVQEADFFAFEPLRRPQVVYERAFLCALPPAMNEAIAARWMSLLPPGGLLAGFFFFGAAGKGPPFPITPEKLDALLSPGFERIEDRQVADSIPVFAGRERWQVWRRKAD